MSPVYALDSWLSLMFKEISFYFDILRDCYEAYVLYTFFNLLVNFLGGEDALEGFLDKKLAQRHPFPCCCLPTFQPGLSFVRLCKFGCWQFAVLKPLLTVIALILELTHNYDEGSFVVNRGYLWVTIFYNISITVAMYMLILFYNAMAEELRPFNPLGKFFCIKAVIFFSFWQGVLLAILKYFEVIKEVGDWSAENIAAGLQDFIICIEMFLIAVAHTYVFPYQPFQRENKSPFLRSIFAGNSEEIHHLKSSMFDAHHPKYDIEDSREILSRDILGKVKNLEKIPLLPVRSTD
jgi:hypothetical protein